MESYMNQRENCCDEGNRTITANGDVLSMDSVQTNSAAALLLKKKEGLCKGKWTLEEERYTNKVIESFNSGVLKLSENERGITLRAYLADKLGCDPMRITKKYTGASCLGKRVYHAHKQGVKTDEIERATEELQTLEDEFRQKLIQMSRKRSNSHGNYGMDCHTHMISTPAIDALLQQGGCLPWGGSGINNNMRVNAPIPNYPVSGFPMSLYPTPNFPFINSYQQFRNGMPPVPPQLQQQQYFTHHSLPDPNSCIYDIAPNAAELRMLQQQQLLSGDFYHNGISNNLNMNNMHNNNSRFGFMSNSANAAAAAAAAAMHFNNQQQQLQQDLQKQQQLQQQQIMFQNTQYIPQSQQPMQPSLSLSTETCSSCCTNSDCTEEKVVATTAVITNDNVIESTEDQWQHQGILAVAADEFQYNNDNNTSNEFNNNNTQQLSTNGWNTRELAESSDHSDNSDNAYNNNASYADGQSCNSAPLNNGAVATSSSTTASSPALKKPRVTERDTEAASSLLGFFTHLERNSSQEDLVTFLEVAQKNVAAAVASAGIATTSNNSSNTSTIL